MMGTDENKGIIPRLGEALFAHIEQNGDANVSYRVEVRTACAAARAAPIEH